MKCKQKRSSKREICRSTTVENKRERLAIACYIAIFNIVRTTKSPSVCIMHSVVRTLFERRKKHRKKKFTNVAQCNSRSNQIVYCEKRQLRSQLYVVNNRKMKNNELKKQKSAHT